MVFALIDFSEVVMTSNFYLVAVSAFFEGFQIP